MSPGSQLTTSEVQKVVVEHIVHGSDTMQSYSGTKLRFFLRPDCQPLVDYETLCSHTKIFLSDPSVAVRYVTRKIVVS